MKKSMFYWILGTILWLLPINILLASSINSIVVDGEELELSSSIAVERGVTLIPIRDIAAPLRISRGWDGNKFITVSNNETNLILEIGNKQANINGEGVQLPLKVKQIDGFTVVPLRFICEVFDGKVEWDTSGRKIIIYTKREVEKMKAKTIAENFIKETYPQKYQQIVVPDGSYLAYDGKYGFNFIRKIEGIEFTKNYIQVEVDGINEKVINHEYEWDDVSTLITQEEATEILKNALKTYFELSFDDQSIDISYGSDAPMQHEFYVEQFCWEMYVKIHNKQKEYTSVVCVDAVTGKCVSIEVHEVMPWEVRKNAEMISEEQALVIAKEYINKVAPEKYKKIDIDEVDKYKKMASHFGNHNFFFVRNIDKTTVDKEIFYENFIEIGVDGVTSKVCYYACVWDEDQ